MRAEQSQYGFRLATAAPSNSDLDAGGEEGGRDTTIDAATFWSLLLRLVEERPVRPEVSDIV
jgi:hypothetical protein